jgi:diaminohydroxyphosphoribosylaminopyrimidine deaminase/5-amino-6-(5-phosphoribosylamino)uracil reductase
MNTQIEPDDTFMQRALALAARGIGLASPNPVVGCVLVDRNNSVIGEGWHEYDRLDHAEVVALKEAKKNSPDRLKGATAYVTLEPCNHTGRTGPCTQALIEAGVVRVVAATRDPNPGVAGGGLDTLHAAGIQTSVGLGEHAARRLNEPFAKWSRTKRPFVLMKVAMTLDGRIAPPAGVQAPRQPYWITSEAARAAVQPLRWQSDAVLSGIDTVVADDPLLTDRSGLPRRRKLLRVVLDSALRLPLDARLVQSADGDVVVFTVSRDEKRAEELRSCGVRVDVLESEGGRVPMAVVLDTLGKEGILSLITETGARLNTGLLDGDHVDRVKFFIAPRIMGTDAVPAFHGLSNAVRMENVEVERYGDDLGVSSLLRDPWA